MIEPVPTYRVRPAGVGDISGVFLLRYDAERWLADSGINQWTSTATGEKVIREQVTRGGTYVVEHGDQIVACLNLGPGDPDFWTPAELRAPALYLYKFIVRTDLRGNGLADVLLDWASLQAELRWGLWLRLDCAKDNAGLHRYYERRGFRRYDTRSAPGRASGAMFERLAEHRLATDPRLVLIDGTEGRDWIFAEPREQRERRRKPSLDPLTAARVPSSHG